MKKNVVIGLLLALVFLPLSAAWAFSVMPLGDSITAGAGSWSTGGYRNELYQLLVAHGYSFDLVGSANSGSVPDADHEGHGGWTADKVRDSVPGLLNLNPADMILLHIGTNDIYGGQSAASVVDEVNEILSNIHQIRPSTHVAVAKIINFQSFSESVSSYNSLLEGMILNDWSHSNHVSLVDMESCLDYGQDMYDGFHPNALGYQKMARAWFSEVEGARGVPIPSTVWLAGSGLVGLMSLRRRLA